MGVILFALTCGYLPFDDPNINVLYDKIMKGSYKAPFFLSAEVKHLLSTMLAVNPKKRATLDQVKRHPWINIGFDQVRLLFLVFVTRV